LQDIGEILIHCSSHINPDRFDCPFTNDLPTSSLKKQNDYPKCQNAKISPDETIEMTGLVI
jgi:hypothetical protein